MIVREEKSEFIMIEQHNHAIASGKLAASWQDTLFKGKEFRKSVEYAIRYHDYGWNYFDKQPLWNDKANKPYDFNDFPLSPKIIVYQHGIDELEKKDSYAALLCSEHYSRFLKNVDSQYADVFLTNEKERQQRIISQLKGLNKRLFDFHYELLMFTDSLSLYLCINEPGVTQENVHYFFAGGIKLPSSFKVEKLIPEWKDEQTIVLDPFPFSSPLKIKIKQKRLSIQSIKENGLVDSYEQAPYEEIEFHLNCRLRHS